MNNNFSNMMSSFPQFSFSSSCNMNMVVTETVKETRHIEVEHSPLCPLRVDSQNGNIKITRAPNSSKVSIVATIRAKSEERLGEVGIKYYRNISNGCLEVEPLWPGNARKSVEGCDFEIKLPDMKDLSATTSNGSIHVVGTNGKVRLTSSNGTISVKNHCGGDIVNVNTSNGDIYAHSIEGDANLNTSNGSINVSEIAGVFNLHSSNGNIKVDLKQNWIGFLTLNTSHGYIRFDKASKNQKLNKNTPNCVELQFGSASGAWSSASTSNASIYLT